MNRQRIVEILEAYRPGEGLESDPEIRQALELAARDPELAAIRGEIQAFDEAFGNALAKVEAPADLLEKILQEAAHGNSQSAMERPSNEGRLLHWFYPASFAAAASIIILLALSFTFWNRPGTANPPQLALASNPISKAAQAVYANLSPSFRPREGSEVIEFIRSRNGAIPDRLPGDIVWDKAFACDVIHFDDYSVSIICFMAPDNSRSMHLLTFLKADFPDTEVPNMPCISNDGKSCCATWASDGQIHVLYSDKGEENLRSVLDI